MKCTKCGRRLTREPGPSGMGPVCALRMLGAKLKRIKREDRRSDDARQLEIPL